MAQSQRLCECTAHTQDAATAKLFSYTGTGNTQGGALLNTAGCRVFAEGGSNAKLQVAP